MYLGKEDHQNVVYNIALITLMLLPARKHYLARRSRILFSLVYSNSSPFHPGVPTDRITVNLTYARHSHQAALNT